MVQCMPDNPIVNKTFYILLQVLFIFIFLTIFFFTYVNSTEKATFKTQMNIVIDDLVLDMNIRPLVPKGREDIATILLYGYLELVRKNAEKSSDADDQKINDQNRHIRNKAFLLVGIATSVLLVIALGLYFTGHCLPFQIHIKEALIIVFFVAITELIFLTVITKEYWSVDPSQIRQKLGNAIQDYIKTHHPQNK